MAEQGFWRGRSAVYKYSGGSRCPTWTRKCPVPYTRERAPRQSVSMSARAQDNTCTLGSRLVHPAYDIGNLLLNILLSVKDKVCKSRVMQSSTTGLALTASALKAHNMNDERFRHYWETQEVERVVRLVKASRELGFELPRSCY